MKQASETAALLLVALVMCSGWYFAGYLTAEASERLAYDMGVEDGKRQAEQGIDTTSRDA